MLQISNIIIKCYIYVCITFCNNIHDVQITPSTHIMMSIALLPSGRPILIGYWLFKNGNFFSYWTDSQSPQRCVLERENVTVKPRKPSAIICNSLYGVVVTKTNIQTGEMVA